MKRTLYEYIKDVLNRHPGNIEDALEVIERFKKESEEHLKKLREDEGC